MITKSKGIEEGLIYIIQNKTKQNKTKTKKRETLKRKQNETITKNSK
jgi:hypothetical protein